MTEGVQVPPAVVARESRAYSKRPHVREFVVAALIVTSAVVPFLASPRLPRELEATSCVRVADLPGPFHLTVNCDSPEFLYLAHDPRLLFSPDHRVRQTRPLYPLIGWALAAPFRALGLAKLGRQLPSGTDITRGGVSYGSYLPEYLAFQLLNWGLLIATIFLLRRLVAAPSYFAPRFLIPLAVVLVNEVTKAFFWTPHLQILNVFISVASLSLLVWMQARGLQLSWRHALGLGLALGVGSLAYGAFAVPAGAAALCLLFGSWSGSQRRLASAVWKIGALVAGFAAPIGAWSAVLAARTGSVYSHEAVVYRQFVWIHDSSTRGAQALAIDLLRDLGEYTSTLQVVTGFCVFTLAGLRMTAYALRIGREPSVYEAVTGRAMIWYVAANATFYGLMGHAPTRLVWTIVPALLVLLGHEVGHLEVALKGKARTVLTVSVAALAAGYVLYWFVRPGPYG